MKKPTIGFALCGSFCTFSKAIREMERLTLEGYDIVPIMSWTAYSTDTRFGRAEDINKRIREICSRNIIYTIEGAEPIGPKRLCDVIAVAPCTGNTMAKIANAITDTSVTMAVKSQLRIDAPVVLALASNDALAASAKNLGALLNTKNIYFVPMSQDDPERKAHSLVAHFDKLEDTITAALEYKQIQPIFAQRS